MENVKQEKRLTVAAKPMNQDQLLTAGDLFDFKLQLLFEIKTLLKEQNGQPNKHWLKSREVRKLPGISPGTLQNLRVRKILSFIRVGCIIYYDAADIQAMLESKKLQNNFPCFICRKNFRLDKQIQTQISSSLMHVLAPDFSLKKNPISITYTHRISNDAEAMAHNLPYGQARTFATTVTLMNGVPIESISKMLGHTKITTTMIYARVN